MKKIDAELVIGLIMLVAIGVLVYLSVRLGQLDLLGNWGYTVYADFTTAGGLQNGAVVELAGVEIGRVESVSLDDYQARVTLKIRDDVVLHEDARAAIKSKGLIGERYVELFPGTGNGKLKPGEQIRKTESPVDIQELISQFIFGNVQEEKQSDGTNPWSLDLE